MIGLEAMSMIRTETSTAVYMIQNSATIPTAVIIESMEISISKIITIINNILKVTFFPVFGKPVSLVSGLLDKSNSIDSQNNF